ncbi:MAG: energy transducer TonB [Blastocatellia bacterium]|nr:energy transducer TonB [Blastocatellia bacterium]
MLDQLIESASTRKKRGRWSYFTVTAAIWMMALTMIVATGIFAYDARLGNHFEKLIIVTPVPAPAPSTGPRSRARSRTSKSQMAARVQPGPVAPDAITMPSKVSPQPPQPGDIIGPVRVGDRNDLPFGSPGSRPDGVFPGESDSRKFVPPPPPERNTKEKAAPVDTTVRRTSIILQGSAIRRVEPQYPPIAIKIGAKGPVVVEVMIDERGNCVSARALSGHPLLRKVSEGAALDWKWKPTILNGVPVKVIGTITFNFQL